jgi:pimeloyl-ACP methyl ester carboxylesterase
MRHPRDIAVIYRGVLADMGLEDPILVGLGFGGWIAAEMATMAPGDLGALVLVGPMGIKPPEGDILDQALLSYIDYARASFSDDKAFDAVYGEEPSTDQLVEWDVCREMNFRIAWKPYMFSLSLPHLLGSVKAPTVIAWGEDDKVVPRSAAALWQKGLPHARLEVVPACGAAVEMEKPDMLTKLVLDVAGNR